MSKKIRNGKNVDCTPEEEAAREKRRAEFWGKPAGKSHTPECAERFIRITVSQARRLQTLKPPPYVTIFQVLLFESFRQHGRPFPLPADALEENGGFSRWTQRRAIVQLEEAGLISVERQD